MRIFLDENIDVDFASLLNGHEVETARSMGWRGLENGELLTQVRLHFEVMITRDRGILFQHKHEGPLSILVLRTPDGKLDSLKKCVPQLEQLLSSNPIGLLIEVRADESG